MIVAHFVGLGSAQYRTLGALTDSAVVTAAQALLTELHQNGCQQSAVPEVGAFQQAYVNAGGDLPKDSGGRSGVDNLYGANTAAALQAVINANPSDTTLGGASAPAGCVGAASGGTGGGQGSTTLSTGKDASTMSMFSTASMTTWGVGLALLAGVAIVGASLMHHPAPARAAAPSRGKGRRRPARRRGRSRRRGRR